VILAGQPRVASAEADLYVTIQYSVGDSVRGCWDEMEFRRRVAHRVGYDPFLSNAPLNATVRIGGTANAVDGHVEWRQANGLFMGERRFVAKDGSCSNLLTEMSFAVGLQIEFLRPKTPEGAGALAPQRRDAVDAGSAPGAPAGIAASTTAAAAAQPATGAQASAEPAAKPSIVVPTPGDVDSSHDGRQKRAEDGAKPAASQSSPLWRMWVGLGPSLAWRLSPTTTVDGRLFLGIRRSILSLEIGVEATYPSTVNRWDGSGFRQGLLGGTVALCAHSHWLSACGLSRLGEVRATGLRVDKTRSPTGFAAQAGVRLAATLSLGGPWLAAAHIDGLGLLTPTRIMLDQAVAWEMPRFGLLAGIDLLVRFR
jgi:hypothetical protein